MLLHRFFLDPLARWWQSRGLRSILDIYEDHLRWSLNNGGKVIGGSVSVLILAFILFSFLNAGVEFFPEDIPPRDAYVQVEAPVGTNVEFTKTIVDELATRVPTIPNDEDISDVLTTSGRAISAGFGSQGTSSHRGTVVINFKDYPRRVGSTFDAIEYMRNNFPEGIAGADITVPGPQSGPPTRKSVSVDRS